MQDHKGSHEPSQRPPWTFLQDIHIAKMALRYKAETLAVLQASGSTWPTVQTLGLRGLLPPLPISCSSNKL